MGYGLRHSRSFMVKVVVQVEKTNDGGRASDIAVPTGPSILS